MKLLWGLLIVFLGAPMASASSVCIKDQYGGRYELNLYKADGYITGLYHANKKRGCKAQNVPLTGSFQGGWAQGIFEVTVPLPEINNCVDIFKIKGTFDHTEWFYQTGPGRQGFRVLDCNSAIPDHENSGQSGYGDVRASN